MNSSNASGPGQSDDDWLEKARLARYQARELARICSLNRRTLERIFQSQLHLSPQRWLEEARQRDLEVAVLSERQLKEVAYLFGYKQPSHMTRKFKETHGVTPSQWRRNSLRSG